MSLESTILLGRGAKALAELEPDEWKRVKARVAWAGAKVNEWFEAQCEMDERCSAAVGTMDEEAFERFCDAEQAKVDAIRAEIRAAADDDKWPTGLYFGAI
jgi:hypothetical protein